MSIHLFAAFTPLLPILQHEREKIVSAAESPNGEAAIPSIATETRGVPVAALTKAVYTGVNDQLQSQTKGPSQSSAAAASSTIPHQRALVATSSPSAVQTIKTLQKIIVRSRGQTKGTADKAKSSRSHTKTHGKISFVDLAKTVAKKWKELDPASKAVYNAFADMERNLYKEKVKAWERKKKAEAEAELKVTSDDKEAAVVADAPKQAAVASNKKPPLGDEQADRMRRILENASRHGSIHNTNVSSSSSDDGSLEDDGDIFPDFAIPQDAARRPVPGTASDRKPMAGTSLSIAELGTGPGPSMSQIASYVYGMHEHYNNSSVAGHKNQVPTGSNLVSRLDRIVRKSRPPKAQTPRRQEAPHLSTSVCNKAITSLAPQNTKSLGSTSLASMLDDMFGTDTDIQAQGGSICQIKDAIAKTTIQHRHNHPMEFGDDDMLFDFSSDHTPAAAAAELNILSPSIKTNEHHIEPAPYVADDAASSAAAMNNPMFDPLHMHAEGVSQANNIGATQGAADPHGLNEFLRWAFENGIDE